DKDGTVVGAGDMKAQAEQVFRNLQAALEAAGATFSDVVKMNTYITDMDKAPAVREVRARYFGESVPASTLVQVVHLARPDLRSDKDGTVVGAGDMKAQAEQVFRNLQAALEAAGATFSDVVKMNTYITDMDKAPAVREVRARYFGESVPASTLVQVVHLARPDL